MPTAQPPVEDRRTILQRLAAIHQAIGVVEKNQKNEQQKFAFRGIDDLMNAIHQHLTEQQVVIVPRYKILDRYDRPTKSGGLNEFVILEGTFTFTGPDGDEVPVVTIGQASDLADKAANKAMSAALKYALIQTFTVPTRDMDDADRTTVENTPAPSMEELVKRIDDCAARIGLPREDVTAKWRKGHGDLSMDQLLALEPQAVYPLVIALEQFVAREHS